MDCRVKPGNDGRAKTDVRLNPLFSVLLNVSATIAAYRCSGLCLAMEGPVRLIARFFADESGATAIEYCLIASGIALAIIVSVQSIGPTLSGKFTAVNSSLK